MRKIPKQWDGAENSQKTTLDKQKVFCKVKNADVLDAKKVELRCHLPIRVPWPPMLCNTAVALTD